MPGLRGVTGLEPHDAIEMTEQVQLTDADYDPLVDDINSLRDSLQQLRALSAADTEAMAACDRIATMVERQEELVERFKTENALMHNSMSFFGRFGDVPSRSGGPKRSSSEASLPPAKMVRMAFSGSTTGVCVPRFQSISF